MWAINTVDGSALKEHTFREYVSIDETTGAVNQEETSADTDVYYAGPETEDEDCASKGKIKDCSIKINLDTELVCYNNKKYNNLNEKSDGLTPGATGYCEMSFKDPTIKKFLFLKSVHIEGKSTKKRDIMDTPFYKIVS
jgi:hypothetical protein